MKVIITKCILAVKLIALILTFLTPQRVQGQVRFDGTDLLIGTADKDNKYHFNMDGYKGLYWSASNNSFLKIDLNSYNDRRCVKFAGSNGFVDFYNAHENHYQALKCYNVGFKGSVIDQTILRIRNGGYACGMLTKISPVAFTWNEKNETNSAASRNGEKVLGLIAQEVEAVFPELVTTDDNGNKLVNYVGLIPILEEALAELNTELLIHAEEIEQLKDELKRIADEKDNM